MGHGLSIDKNWKSVRRILVELQQLVEMCSISDHLRLATKVKGQLMLLLVKHWLEHSQKLTPP